MAITTHPNQAATPTWAQETEDAAPVGRIHRAVFSVSADDQCGVELQRIDFDEDDHAPGEVVVLLDGQVLSHRGALRLLADLQTAVRLGWDQHVDEPVDGWLADHLLTSAQAAQVLQCSEWTLGQLRRDGKVAGVKVGRHYRFDPTALRDFITRRGQR